MGGHNRREQGGDRPLPLRGQLQRSGEPIAVKRGFTSGLQHVHLGGISADDRTPQKRLPNTQGLSSLVGGVHRTLHFTDGSTDYALIVSQTRLSVPFFPVSSYYSPSTLNSVRSPRPTAVRSVMV